MADVEDTTLANLLRPLTKSTITVRCIKSFEYRTCKNLILHDVNLMETTVGDLKTLIRESAYTASIRYFTPLSFLPLIPRLPNVEIQMMSGFKPYLNVVFDTLKLYTVAHGHKVTPTAFLSFVPGNCCMNYYTMNLIINIEDDERLIFADDSATLTSLGLENEAEISFFNRESYEAFKQHPDTIKW
ncbi:hypothetical protein BC936DRAFT_138308 [Jimgerdemannia flammicorona]|uniref:Uncharacterized protein n=1 Tax=Jimgerdemannia flammicorona TaxID=994334 RepID=A0A433DIM4_9FUNG|nr:hypothetical protein BC936DRAFT_138308 [Jimgerdemannia flammicorona]